MMMELLTLVCVGLSLAILLAKDSVHAVILLAALNLFVALIFYLARAPDLAVTQASVNAALATMIFVYAIRRYEP